MCPPPYPTPPPTPLPTQLGVVFAPVVALWLAVNAGLALYGMATLPGGWGVVAGAGLCGCVCVCGGGGGGVFLGGVVLTEKVKL